MTARLRKILKWLLGGVVLAGVLIGLTFVAFGVVVGRVPEYRVQLQDWLNERSGLAVEFRTLSARLRVYGPELVFNDAVVRTPDGTRVLATAKRGSVGFDLWNSLREGRLTAGRFALDSPQLGLIRTRAGRIQLVGQSALPERDTPFALEQLPTGRFHVENAVVSFRDEITVRGPWSLSGVSFDLTRTSDSMQLRGDASLPHSLGRELRFSAQVQGPLQDAAALVSTFSVEGRELDLAGWADVLPDEWPAPETGHGTLGLRGVLKGAKLVQLAADANLTSVTAVLPQWAIPLPGAEPLRISDSDSGEARGPAAHSEQRSADPGSAAPEQRSQMASYSRVAFGLRAQQVNDAWSLSLENVELAGKASTWRAGEIEVKWSRGADGAMTASGKADRLVLENLWPLLAYLPQSEQLARVRALQASGTVANVAFDYARASAQSAPRYSARAELTDLAIRPVARAPGFAGLSGKLDLTDAGGDFHVDAQDLQFELPRLFRNVLGAKSVDGIVRWRKADNEWSVSADQVRLQAEDGQAVARFALTLPADGTSPTMDLSAQAQDLKVSSTHKYIPADRLGARSLEWFDHAFVDGRVANAELILKGPLQAFPFRQGEGTFLVRGHVENAVFAYQPDWTEARDVTAEVEFHNEGMHIRASGANVGGLKVSAATADIPDLRYTRLSLTAAASGDLNDGLAFLKRSPLAPSLGTAFARLGGHGQINAQVSLYLPIQRLADRRIEVKTRFVDAAVSMQNIDAPVRSLDGTLTVRNTLVAEADLHGQWLGGPLEVSIRPQGATAAVLNATGQALAAQLKPVLALPTSVNVSGAARWHLTTVFNSTDDDSKSSPSSVRIESDLQGLGIALPEPLGKTEDESRAFQVTIEQESDDAVLARAALGNVRSLVRVQRSDSGWELDRGGIRADGAAPSLPSHHGLRIEGAVEHFVLDDWLALAPKGDDSSGGSGKPLVEILQGANVRVGAFEFGGYRWSDVRGMLQATPSGWRVDVDAPGAAGQVLIPESFSGGQTLRATLERLHLDRVPATGPSAPSERDPRDIPSLQVYVADLQIGARAIGAVDLKATRVPEGIRLDHVLLDGASAHAEGQGEWLVTPSGEHSSLRATITSEDVAATLRALNYTDIVDAKHGELQGDLSWSGGFDDNMLDHASGTISVHAEKGQLLAVQPGAGRVLGLFSVAALPRRLALDFKDLTEKGLAFDTVRGDFELRDGNAYTSNLLLRGPAAEIGIAGRTGLATRDYDQTAVVTGNLGASIPVAGALAAGPAFGAALLLFSQVFKEPLKGITRGYYRITGPWDNPTIERVDAATLKMSEQKGVGPGR